MVWVNVFNRKNITMELWTLIILVVSAKFSEAGEVILDLSNRSLTELNVNFFTNHKLITRVQLNNNHLLSFEDKVLSELISLQELNLSKNALSFVSFNKSQNLQVLDLSHNNLTELPPLTNLGALRVLNVSWNEINSLNWLTGLNNLVHLDLSHNILLTLGERALAAVSSLQQLSLSSNHLNSLEARSLDGLSKLQRLDLSGNELAEIAPGSFAPLVGLAELSLADNRLPAPLQSEFMVLVGSGHRLRTVDASRAGLQHVPAALTRSVRSLALSGNLVTGIRCGDLDSYPLLQRLDLSENYISDLEEDALGRLEMLRELFLSGNQLHNIPRSLPSGLTALYLQRNSITRLKRGDLLGLGGLKELHLRETNLESIEEGAFAPMQSLHTLDLSGNPLVTLESNALLGPVQLRVLDLSLLTNATQLDLDMSFPVRSPERLEKLSLDGSPSLARQWLADTAALAAARRLTELGLANAELESLRPDIVNFLPRLRVIRLIGNPIPCEKVIFLQSVPDLIIDTQCNFEKNNDLTITTTLVPNWNDSTPNITLMSSSINSSESITEVMDDISNITRNIWPATNTEAEYLGEVITPGQLIAENDTNLFEEDETLETGSHPGMLVLAAGAAAAALALAMTFQHCSKQRRRIKGNVEYARQQDVEVRSLASMSDLW